MNFREVFNVQGDQLDEMLQHAAPKAISEERLTQLNHIILNNLPPVPNLALEEQYDTWWSLIQVFIKGLVYKPIQVITVSAIGMYLLLWSTLSPFGLEDWLVQQLFALFFR